MSRIFVCAMGTLLMIVSSGAFSAQDSGAKTPAPDKAYEATSRKLEDEFRDAANAALATRTERHAKAKQLYDSSIASADAPFKNSIEGARIRWENARKKAIGSTIEGMDKKIAELNKKGEVEAAKDIGRQKEDFTQNVIRDNARIAALLEGLFSGTQKVMEKPKKTHPSDAISFNGHFYKFFPDRLTWHQAKRKCEEIGGYILCIETREEEQFIHDLAKPQADFLWLGLTDEEEEGHWKWVTGQNLTFADWSKGEPNNGQEAENVAAYFLKDGGWNDVFEGKRWPFVCEWDH